MLMLPSRCIIDGKVGATCPSNAWHPWATTKNMKEYKFVLPVTQLSLLHYLRPWLQSGLDWSQNGCSRAALCQAKLKNSGDGSVSTLASGGSCGRNRPNKNVILNTDKLAKHAQPHKKTITTWSASINAHKHYFLYFSTHSQAVVRPASAAFRRAGSSNGDAATHPKSSRCFGKLQPRTRGLRCPPPIWTHGPPAAGTVQPPRWAPWPRRTLGCDADPRCPHQPCCRP